MVIDVLAAAWAWGQSSSGDRMSVGQDTQGERKGYRPVYKKKLTPHAHMKSLDGNIDLLCGGCEFYCDSSRPFCKFMCSGAPVSLHFNDLTDYR